MMSAVISYGRAKRLIAGAFVLYAFVGVTAEMLYVASGEVQPPRIYPFFMWSMFAHIPNPGMTYTVRILALGDERFDPPLLLEDSGPMLQGRYRVTDYIKRIVVEYGRAVDAGDRDAAGEARRRFERIFDGRSFSYEVIRIHKDPIRYWHERKYEVSEIVAQVSSL